MASECRGPAHLRGAAGCRFKKIPDMSAENRIADPKRFTVSRRTLLTDKLMTLLIKLGGVGIIAGVCAMFVFIVWQVIPLFGGAQVKPAETFELELPKGAILGFDEWEQRPFSYQANDRFIIFYDLKNKASRTKIPLKIPEETRVECVRYDRVRQDLILGLSDGRFMRALIAYEPEFSEDGARRIVSEVHTDGPYPLGKEGYPLLQADYGQSQGQRLAAGLQRIDGKNRLFVQTFLQKRSLLGEGKVIADRHFDLTDLIPVDEHISEIRVLSSADGLLIATEEGEIHYLFDDGEKFSVRQSFFPFGDLTQRQIQTMGFVFGDVSLVCVNREGATRVFSLLRPEGESVRLWRQTKSFPQAPSGNHTDIFDHSVLNKAFLLGGGQTLNLCYNTTESIRWSGQFDYGLRAAFIGPKYTTLNIVDDKGNLRVHTLNDPHPDAGWKAFFGKIWYEGASKPEYTWQSSNANDDSEAKLSLIPLIFGTLKGTFFALLFALPISIMAAIYTSQFLHPQVKGFVKPLMEIMASLPSVVLGFLGALWLAPLLDTKIPSVLAMMVLVPVAAMGFGWAWTLLPLKWRKLIAPGRELFVAVPIVLLAAWIGWEIGPLLERLFFVVSDPASGAKIADFRLWWPQATGIPYDQRNSLVVGFMMGFAVIPIIFTIAEDALSNVPSSLTSGSLALGASRWQTCRRIVLPTAAAGIFSALMIGFGRAVGETMIVVMATGNTPLMDWNIFSGMRTLSANIAMELPEAPQGSTHYRALFLGAVVLFLFTFILNSVAEILRQRLRDKYKTF